MPHHTEIIEKNPRLARRRRPARAAPNGRHALDQTRLATCGDAVSPHFARLMLEVKRLPGSKAEKAAEIEAHLKLYRSLVDTQGERIADETVQQLAAFYRFRRKNPDEWRAYEDQVARRATKG